MFKNLPVYERRLLTFFFILTVFLAAFYFYLDKKYEPHLVIIQSEAS